MMLAVLQGSLKGLLAFAVTSLHGNEVKLQLLISYSLRT